jgi:hypothetical protein
MKCQETVWTHRGPARGEFVKGHTAPCPNRATWTATDTQTGVVHRLCGRHANTDRYANYPDLFVWVEGTPDPEGGHHATCPFRDRDPRLALEA